MTENKTATRLFVTPSLKVTGGNLEIIRLAREIVDAGINVDIVAMWRTEYEADTGGIPVIHLSSSLIEPRTVIAEYAAIAWRFWGLLTRLRPASTVFTHYTTLPLSWMVNPGNRWFFVQGVEWLFVSGRAKRAVLKWMILASLRRGKVLSANRYLTAELHDQGVTITAETPIWADSHYLSETTVPRDIDVAVMLRLGAPKRADLTLTLMREILALQSNVRLLAIAADDTFRASIPAGVDYVERPTLTEMRSLYERTKLFALMSEHEGFGLPPLEAMGSGCVPLCRDAGGVRSYMVDELADNVFPLDLSTAALAERTVKLLQDEPRRARLSDLAREIFKKGQEDSGNRAAILGAAGF